MIPTKAAGLIIAFIFTALIFLSACSRTSLVVPEAEPGPESLKRLLVIPIQDMTGIYGENVIVRCPLCGNIVTTGKVEPGASEMLTRHLIEEIKRHQNIELIPFSQAQGVISELLSRTEKELPDNKLYLRTGQALGADAVLAGYVYRFRERDGTDYSVNLPASVAFDIDLIRVADGRIFWSGHFNETQQSLTHNLLQLGTFIKRKGKWITAEALAVFGLRKVLQTFPAL